MYTRGKFDGSGVFTWGGDSSSWQGSWNKNEPEGSGTYVVLNNSGFASGGWDGVGGGGQGDDEGGGGSGDEEDREKLRKLKEEERAYYGDAGSDDDSDDEDGSSSVTVFGKGPNEDQRNSRTTIPEMRDLDTAL